MEKFNVIEFHRTRDFSRKLNATFEFIKQNFKSLGKSILFIAGPPLLLASLIIGSFIGEFVSFTQMAAMNGGQVEGMENYFFSASFWLQLLLMIVFFTVSGVMNIATIYNYIMLYEEKRTNEIEVSEVWERVRATFWMYFGTMVLFVILCIAMYIVLMIPFGILVLISPVLVAFGGFFMFFGFIYAIFAISLTFFIRGYEKKGFFESIGRSFTLVKSKWWSTFGLLVVLYLVMMIVSYIFLIPYYVIADTMSLHDISNTAFAEASASSQLITTIFFTLFYLVQMVLAALPNVGIAFQYFNLVELKEARGLITQIETFGQTQTQPSPQDEHF